MDNEARTVQIRRGPADKHEEFIGAIGELTMDTDNKTIRVHDGETVGGIPLARQSEIPDLSNADYVVEFQKPTAANNYVWYRKYKSGWVEQGGRWAGELECEAGQEVVPTIYLPIKMLDDKYFISSSVVDIYLFQIGVIREPSNCRIRFGAYQVNRTLTEFIWKAEGVAY